MIQIVFLKPEFLLLLIFVPLLVIVHFLVLKYLRRRALKFANFEAIKRVVGPQGSSKNVSLLSKNIGLLVLRILALSFIILAISNPLLYYTGRTTKASFVIAIDASSSMLASDFQPTRLTVAKSEAIDFVSNLPRNSRVGVIDFSGAAFVKSQILSDKKKVIDAIKGINIEKVGGTDIGSAIITASNLLINEQNSKVIILLTDGRSNVGVEPKQGVEYAKSKNIQIYTIGVATKKGASLFDSGLVSTIDDTSLKNIASETHGSYFRAENPDELKKAYSSILQLSYRQVSTNLTMPLLVMAIILLFIEWSLANTKYRTLP